MHTFFGVSISLLLTLSTAQWVYARFCSRRGIPKTISWAGVSSGGFEWFARAKATARSLTGTRGLIEEAYQRVSCPYNLPMSQNSGTSTDYFPVYQE